MPEFNHPPSIQVLQALVGASFTDANNLNKAVRLWYTLCQFGTEFQPERFTDRQWREYLYKSPDNNRDNKPAPVDGCLCTKPIAAILFDRDRGRAEQWSHWQRSLRSALSGYYRSRDIPEIADANLAAYLQTLELEKPFNVTGKTILGDLKTLTQLPKTSESKYLISLSSSEFQLPDKFPVPIAPEQPISAVDRVISIQDPGYLTGDFSSFAYLFSEPTRDIQRFYIHADYQIPTDKVSQVNQYLQKLRANWSKDRTTPYQLQYYSSSQVDAKRRSTVVVYPVCLYYYQRSFYLCAFGAESDAEFSWHNYRLDRIERLADLDWERDRELIPQLLVDRCAQVDDLELIDSIGSELDEAYGFDFYRSSAQMLLRFDRNFHDRYIKNTFRHQTFQPISKPELLKTYPNLKVKIDRYPDAAYYTMKYRVGDNSAIMRLRAWCPNVEVLLPLDLRDRMRNDLQKTWELYRDER
jgi:CRISPR-associated protein (TIGR03985 family)